MLVDLTPTWPIVIPQPPEARVWCRRPLVVEVLVLGGVVAGLAVLGLLLWPLSTDVMEQWRIIAIEAVAATVLLAVAGRFLVPRRSEVVLTEEGILRRDSFSLFGLAVWTEDNWLAAWEDVLSYQLRDESGPIRFGEREEDTYAGPGAPGRLRLTFNVLGRYGSRPLEVLCSGSQDELQRLEAVLQGSVARNDGGLLEAYRLKRPSRARRWDALMVAVCLAVALFPDLALQALITACGSPILLPAPPLDSLSLWRYVLGGAVIVLGVSLTTRVQHAVSPALALAVFFFTVPAALVPVDGLAVRDFLAGSLSFGATLGVAVVILLKLGVLAAVTAAWLEYVTRGVHDGSARKFAPRRPGPPLPPRPQGR